MGKFTRARLAHTSNMSNKFNFRRLISVTHSVRAFFVVVFRCFSFQCLTSLTRFLSISFTVLLALVAFGNKSLHSTKHCCSKSASDAYLIDTHTRDERRGKCGWTRRITGKINFFFGLIAKLTKLVRLILCEDRRQCQQHHLVTNN